MKISEYTHSAWSIHAETPEQVLKDVKEQFKYLETEEDILKLAHLIVHVAGEHLGKWQEGLALLRNLKHNPLLKNKSDMLRFMAILELGNNPNISIEKFSTSDQARIMASTSSALVSLGGLKSGENLFNQAVTKASSLEQSDPAFSSLAVSANNIASKLEDKAARSEIETSLMLKAAKTARVFWEKAGTWKEVERAEYRLAHSYLKAEQFDMALKHADLCLEIVAENKNIPLEHFFALEVKVLALKATGKNEEALKSLNTMEVVFNTLSSEDKIWCESTLKKLS